MYSIVIFFVLMLLLGLFFALIVLLIAKGIMKDTLAYDNEYLWKDYRLSPKDLGFNDREHS